MNRHARRAAVATNRRQKTCPHCGLVLLFDDDAQTIHHEAPECPTFARIIAVFKAAAEAQGGTVTTRVTIQEYEKDKPS